MIRWLELSIRARLVLATAALLGAISLAPLVVLPDQLEAHERAGLERRAVDLAGAFGAAGEAALDFGDRQRAADVLRGLATAGGATYGVLLRSDGSVLASWGRDGAPLLALAGAGPTLRYAADELHARVPLVAPGGERGSIQLGLDLDALLRRRAESRALVLRTAAASFVVGLAAVFLIATLLTKPVRTLTSLARRIASGDEHAAAQLATGRDEAGTVAAALGSVVARLAAQRAMLESQSEATIEGILTLDAAGAVITHNRRLREILGLRAEELQGASWRTLRPRLVERLVAALPAWLAAEAPALSGPEAFDVATVDGRTLEVHAAPVRRASGEALGLGLYFRDVTRAVQDRRAIEELALGLERRVEQRTRELAAANEELAARLAELHRTQEQLVLADRRISVGRLAAGVAHEVNNPLSYVLGNVTWVADELGGLRSALAELAPGPRAAAEARLERMRTALEDAADGGQRVAHIVRELRTFSRGDEERRGPTDLRRAMLAALEMARHELRLRARLVEHLGDAPLVDGNEMRLSQVFLNLLINAGHAIEPGAVDRNVIEATIGTDGDGWSFAEIRDTGCGMSPEIQSRIFDPFFTTKAQGQGTGLGLSISQGIVTSFGGTISVTSSPGMGSTFRVRLPPTSVEAPPPAPPEAAVTAERRKLLVVDDEPLVLDALVRSLSEHDVTAVHTGTEALERILRGERYDRILCDLMMPVMSGMELHDELLRVAPDQASAMVFISGGAFTPASDAFVEANRDRFVAKPFDRSTLRRVIHASPAG
jgi:PAS domain S-box-containing protein